jgi:Tfp pilus assembly PilM family ATPase
LDAEEANRIAEVLARRGFVGQEVVVTAPPSLVSTALLDLPPAGPDVPLDAIAANEFARLLKLDPAEVTMSHWTVPTPARGGTATHELAVGCAATAAEGYLDVLESGGLSAVAMDVGTSALARACLPLAMPAPAMLAVVDLGWEAATLAVVVGGVLAYERRVADAGLRHLLGGMADISLGDDDVVPFLLWEVGLSDGPLPEGVEDGGDLLGDLRRSLESQFTRLAVELGMAFGYVAHQYPDGQLSPVLLAGGGANLPGVARYLGEQLGISVEVADPAKLVAAGGPAMPVDALAAMGCAVFDGGTD